MLSSLGCLVFTPVQTVQAMPVPPQPNPKPSQPAKPLPELPEVIPPQNSPPSVPLPPEKIPGKITVKRFAIVGNNVIPQAEIEEIVAPYLNRPISFVELLAVPRKITQLYVDRGYLTSGAFIPPQAIENEVVQVQILEGKIEEIQMSGLTRLKPSYIRSRLAIATKAPLNQQQLLNALQLLQFSAERSSISTDTDCFLRTI
jgi:hemolysin activation/secretion protein